MEVVPILPDINMAYATSASRMEMGEGEEKEKIPVFRLTKMSLAIKVLKYWRDTIMAQNTSDNL